MEILDLRLLHAYDLAALLEEEKEVWRECLRWDYSTTAAMVQRFMEARALTGYALFHEGAIAGYSFFVYEGHKGLIGDIFVTRDMRTPENEVKLLASVLETLQATPGLRRIEAQMLNSDSHALRQYFSAKGFNLFDRKFLVLSLGGDQRFETRSQRSAELRLWDSRRLNDAAELITRSYRGHIDATISDQYRTQAGAARFLENIVQYPGCGPFQPDCSFLAFGADGRLHGMLLASAVADGVAHITQLCIAPEAQGRGIGHAMVARALGTLNGRGFQSVTLTVTASNMRAIQLYRKFGFADLAQFPAFTWDAQVSQSVMTEKRAMSRFR